MANSNPVVRFPLTETICYAKHAHYNKINQLLAASSPALTAACMAGLDAASSFARLRDTCKRLKKQCPLESEERSVFECIRQYLEQIEISFRKDTTTHNTSVTAGIAARLLKCEGEMVWILNCGTGDVKYQLYSFKNGTPNVVKEVKSPGKGMSVSGLTSLIESAGYDPLMQDGDEKPSPITDEALILGLCQDLQPLVANFPAPVYAVITGTIRQHRANLLLVENSPIPRVMDNELERVFQRVCDTTGIQVKPWNGESYFISQTGEGECEFIACKNLVSSVKPNSRVIGFQGIGKGSSQFGLLLTNRDGTSEHRIFGFPYGMNKYTQLSGLGNFIECIFNDPMILEKFFLTLITLATKGETPVFALKSGCLIAVDKSPELKMLLDPRACTGTGEEKGEKNLKSPLEEQKLVAQTEPEVATPVNNQAAPTLVSNQAAPTLVMSNQAAPTPVSEQAALTSASDQVVFHQVVSAYQ